LSRLGRISEAEPELRRAIGLMQGLVAGDPKHEGYRRMMAAMDADLAWVSERLVLVAEKHKTEGFYRADLQSKERLLAAPPNAPQRRYGVVDAKMKLGRPLLGPRPQEAERLFRAAIPETTKLTGESPHTTQSHTDRADPRHGLLVLLRAGRRFDE